MYLPNGEIDHKNYIQHGIRGYELLQSEDFDEKICRFALCHTGVGLTKADVFAQNLPLPPRDYVAKNANERLVMYADKFHTKTTPPKLMSVTTYRKYTSRFGMQNVHRFNKLIAEFGEPELALFAKNYNLEVS